MIEWLTQRLAAWGLNWHQVMIGAVIFVVSFAVSLALVTLVLVKLPVTYFQPTHGRDFLVNRRRAVRWSGLVFKNLIGFILVVLGILMSVPGVPGQGFLTILLGIMLLDFPGKRQLEYKLVSRPKVLQTMNGIRKKFGKPPLILEAGVETESVASASGVR